MCLHLIPLLCCFIKWLQNSRQVFKSANIFWPEALHQSILSAGKSQNNATFKLILRLSHFIYHTLTSHWRDTHRGWWSPCVDTLALLETEQIGKRHPCSGRPQEEQRRNALPRKQRQEPRALSAKVTLLVLRCPGTACQISPGRSQIHAWPSHPPAWHLCSASTALASHLLKQLQTCRVICSHVQQAGMQCLTSKYLIFP